MLTLFNILLLGVVLFLLRKYPDGTNPNLIAFLGAAICFLALGAVFFLVGQIPMLTGKETRTTAFIMLATGTTAPVLAIAASVLTASKIHERRKGENHAPTVRAGLFCAGLMLAVLLFSFSGMILKRGIPGNGDPVRISCPAVPGLEMEWKVDGILLLTHERTIVFQDIRRRLPDTRGGLAGNRINLYRVAGGQGGRPEMILLIHRGFIAGIEPGNGKLHSFLPDGGNLYVREITKNNDWIFEPSSSGACLVNDWHVFEQLQFLGTIRHDRFDTPEQQPERPIPFTGGSFNPEKRKRKQQ